MPRKANRSQRSALRIADTTKVFIIDFKFQLAGSHLSTDSKSYTIMIRILVHLLECRPRIKA